MEFDSSIDREVIEKFFPKNKHNVGIGEIILGRPPAVLSATALGSCLGVVIYDKFNKIASFAHVALPTVKEAAYYSHEELKKFPGKFSDIAVPKSIEMLEKKKVLKLEAKIVGGSNVLNLRTSSGEHLGKRNINAVIDQLKDFGIPIRGKDVDGKFIRSVKFYIENAMLEIKKTIKGKTKNNYSTVIDWI